MFKSCFQIAGEALAIAALSPINTLTDLGAAASAAAQNPCWIPPPMEQSGLGMQITVLMSIARPDFFGIADPLVVAIALTAR